MTNWQNREAFRIHADREERYAERSWRDQLIAERKARELREENARRMAAASR